MTSPWAQTHGIIGKERGNNSGQTTQVMKALGWISGMVKVAEDEGNGRWSRWQMEMTVMMTVIEVWVAIDEDGGEVAASSTEAATRVDLRQQMVKVMKGTRWMAVVAVEGFGTMTTKEAGWQYWCEVVVDGDGDEKSNNNTDYWRHTSWSAQTNSK